MTQEEKQLLLIDLCARLPYNVTCQFTWTYCNETTDGEEVIAKENDNIRNIDILTKEIQTDYYGEWVDLEHCKPYLRSMSNMTEEECKEFCKISGLFKKEDGNFSNHLSSEWGNTIITERVMVRTIDWLNAHQFDYRGLIPMGIALVAPEGMYKV